MNRHLPTDIPYLVRLLDCTAGVGREGDTVQEILIDELQQTIPIEYEGFSMRMFIRDAEYREGIKSKYMQWWTTHGPEIRYDSKWGQYFLKGTPDNRLDAHASWYLRLVTSRLKD